MATVIKKKLATPVKKPLMKKPAAREDTDLDSLQDAWESAEPRQAGVPLPDGTYEGIIQTAVIGESKNRRPQVVWELVVTGQECQGRECRKFSGLATKENMDWLKGDIAALGLELPERLSELVDVLEQAQGLKIRFQVRTGGEYTNIDFIEALADDGSYDSESTEDETTEESEAGDDTPTKADIKKMNRIQLVKIAKDYGLSAKDYPDNSDLKDALIDNLGLTD